MRKIVFFSLLLVLLLHPSAIVPAQTGAGAEIRRIDAYRRQVDAFVRRYKRPHLIFADSSDYTENRRPRWRRFASERHLEKAREKQDFHDIALVWRRNGRIVLTSFTLSSPSGDWAHYVFHYFRPDGTVAKVDSELRTFHGDFIARQNFYFDRKGEIVKKTREFKDLTTGEPKEPSTEELEANSSFLNEIDFYRRTNKLPFASLLRKKRK